jgi:hypothetical protein
MNNVFKPKQHAGFIALATMVLMLASLGVVTAILYRSTQGQVLVGRLKAGDQAYQKTDTTVESVLQRFRDADAGKNEGDSGINFSLRVPENIVASEFCASMVCYDRDGADISADAKAVLSQVERISVEGKSGSATRSIQAPVLERIMKNDPPTVDDASPRSVGPADALESLNTNDVAIEWGTLTPSQLGLIDQLVIRRASTKRESDEKLCGENSDSDCSMDNELDDDERTFANTKLYWYQVGTITHAQLTQASPVTKFIDKEAGNFPPGTVLAYTIKATNKDPLKLDSPYSKIRSIKIGESVGDTDLSEADRVTTVLASGGGALNESCKTDIGAKMSTTNACQTFQPEYAIAYNGYDGLSDGKPGGTDDKGMSINAQYTCHTGHECSRCPKDKTTGGYAWKWMWSSWEYNFSQNRCVEKCADAAPDGMKAPQCWYGTATDCAKNPSVGPRTDPTCNRNDSVRTVQRTVDASKSIISNDPTKAVGYCFVFDKNRLPGDSSFAQACNTIGGGYQSNVMKGSFAANVTEQCDALGNDKPYTSYAPAPHPGVSDTRTCVPCAVKYSTAYAYDPTGSGALTDGCRDMTPKVTLSANPTGLSWTGGSVQLSWTTANVAIGQCAPGGFSMNNALNGSTSVSIFPSGTSSKTAPSAATSGTVSTYNLSCTNAFGSKSASVRVTRNGQAACPATSPTCSVGVASCTYSPSGSSTLVCK